MTSPSRGWRSVASRSKTGSFVRPKRREDRTVGESSPLTPTCRPLASRDATFGLGRRGSQRGETPRIPPRGEREQTMLTGAFRERIRNSWVEMRENLGRATLQSLGVMLGVASVLGGFSISDSMRQRSKQLYVKMGGLDKLNVQPSAIVKDGSPTALQMANLGLRTADADEGGESEKAITGVSIQKFARAR